MDNSQQDSYIDNYQFHGLIGKGGQANVYKCSRDGQIYAAKIYHDRNLKVEAFQKQVDFLSKLNFKYLINICESNIQAKVKLPYQNEIVCPVIFMEMAEGGELFEYIDQTGPFSQDICRTLIKMLIETVEHLNSIEISHRDLKLQNILFDRNFNIKVADFGLSTFSKGHFGDGILYSQLGTDGYKPPEMEAGQYTGLQADLFATGVILFNMYAKSVPFKSTKNTDPIYRLIREKRFKMFWGIHEKKKPKGFFSGAFKKLLNSFFSADISQRPTFESLKVNQWLNGDEALQSDIVIQMKARYDHIQEKKKMKQKNEKKKVQQLVMAMDEEGSSCQGKGTRSIEVYNRIQVMTEMLPHSNKCQLIATNVSASVLIAWFENFIKEAFEKQNVFLTDPPFTIEPVNYSLNYDKESNIIKIDLMFRVKEGPSQNEVQTIQELSVEGNLVQLRDKKLSVDWQKVNGNPFWLSSLITQLNFELNALA